MIFCREIYAHSSWMSPLLLEHTLMSKAMMDSYHNKCLNVYGSTGTYQLWVLAGHWDLSVIQWMEGGLSGNKPSPSSDDYLLNHSSSWVQSIGQRVCQLNMSLLSFKRTTWITHWLCCVSSLSMYYYCFFILLLYKCLLSPVDHCDRRLSQREVYPDTSLSLSDDNDILATGVFHSPRQ